MIGRSPTYRLRCCAIRRMVVVSYSRWISRNRFIADLALLVGPIVLGLAIDFAGFDAAFYLAAVLVFGTILLMLTEWRANRAAKLEAL